MEIGASSHQARNHISDTRLTIPKSKRGKDSKRDVKQSKGRV